MSLATDKHEGAAKVIAELRGKQRDGGIPWMTVLDPTGKELVTSDGPGGNIGCPVQPPEVAWFRTMLERSRQRLTDADLDTIERANEAFAAPFRRK